MTESPREQRLVFGEVAEAYDRARPRYPSQLVDDVVSFARLGPRDRVLEVGCGVFERLTQGLARLIDDTGGELRVDYVTRLHLARRAGERPLAGRLLGHALVRAR